MTSESVVAGKVLWGVHRQHDGMIRFGAPVVVTGTVKYGWVVIFTSGYDNSDGNGYLYHVNPATGALLEKVQTPQL